MVLHERWSPVADAGFPVRRGRRQPPTRALLSRNVCENERIGSLGGGALDPPMVPELEGSLTTAVTVVGGYGVIEITITEPIYW